MNKRGELEDVKYSCRVCLSRGEKMFFLDNPLKEENSPSILQILEMIICTKVELNNSYPCLVCADCLKFLNVAYDFKLRFEHSQKILQNFLDNYEGEKKFLQNDVCGNNKECESNEDVETIYIKYTDIHEDLDVKQTEAEDYDYENTENPSDDTGVWDQIVMPLEENEIKPSKFSNSKKRRGRKQSFNVDKYIIEYTDTNPVSLDLKNLPDVDDELFRAACNLKYKCSACPKLYSSKGKLEKHEEGCKKLKCRINYKKLCTAKNVAANQDNYLLLYQSDKCSRVYSSKGELDDHTETTRDSSHTDTFLKIKVEGLSEIDKELFRSASLLKYQCDSCTKVYSSHERFNRHKTVCGKSKKK
ncbi:uncharacterized protein LOC108910105 [Anoplophora glabripennis]|uniref:uncharacterized protein LOC108910105 n=1 Tax=Anoplophora glabripennis TaxID=217634 RepID=UPI0008739DBC|nr:uncharacterized protein LOC108910105 [Anoplophora glabripennis]